MFIKLKFCELLYANFLCNDCTCNILRHWWYFCRANLGIRTKIGYWFWAKFAYRNNATKRAWSSWWIGDHFWNKMFDAEVLRGKLSSFCNIFNIGKTLVFIWLTIFDVQSGIFCVKICVFLHWLTTKHKRYAHPLIVKKASAPLMSCTVQFSSGQIVNYWWYLVGASSVGDLLEFFIRIK